MRNFGDRANPVLLLGTLPRGDLLTAVEASKYMGCGSDEARTLLDEMAEKTRLVARVEFSSQVYYMIPRNIPYGTRNVAQVQQVFLDAIRAKQRRDARKNPGRC